MSTFLKEEYKTFEAYTPGEQPQDMQYIKLNTNEAPFAHPEAVKRCLDGKIDLLCRYPDPTVKVLREKLAALYGVNKENVFVSNGSDDILNFAVMAFAKKACFADITYGFYPVVCDLHGIEYEKIPLKEDFTICADDYKNKDAMILIANPNAPTGIALGLDDIEKIVSENKDNVVLIDEAYVDFGAKSAKELVKKYKNLMVCMTFSKSRSLAGARVGFAIADEEIIKDLEKIKYSTNPYSINSMSYACAVAVADNNDYYMNNCEKIIKTREKTVTELRKKGFFVLDSKANFVFAKSDKISGEELYLKLKERGVLVRHFSGGRIKDFNRITIGTDEQMDESIKTVNEILKECE